MKKRIIAWAVLLSVCAAALGLWCSAAAGKTARTLPCKEEGLILSITTFDGKSESKPFLKCFGHTWIGLDNRTGHTVYLKDRAIPDGEMVTFSVWAVSGISGLLFDLEPCYIANYGRYTGRLSLSTKKTTTASRMCGRGCLRWRATPTTTTAAAQSTPPRWKMPKQKPPTARISRSCWWIRMPLLRCTSVCTRWKSHTRRSSACECLASCPLTASGLFLVTMPHGRG